MMIFKNWKSLANTCAAGLAIAMCAAGATGCSSSPGRNQPLALVEAASAVDERATTVLKAMGETLAKAKSFSVQAESSVSIVSPGGQWVHVFGTSQITLQRPDHLYVETRGDLFPENFYFDGKKLTMYATEQKLYAQADLPGNIDQMLKQAFEKHGTYLPFTDVLHATPHEVMTKLVTGAQYVGQSKVGGVLTDHLAFIGGEMEWEIWIGADDKLPRILMVSFADVKGKPTNSIAFSDWKLNVAVPESTFQFTPPEGAARIEFKKPELTKEK